MSDELIHYGVLGMKWGVRKDGKPQGYQGDGKGRGRKAKATVKRMVSNPDYKAEKKAMADRRAVRKNARSQIKEINRRENEAIANRKREELKPIADKAKQIANKVSAKKASNKERKAANKERYSAAKETATTGQKALSLLLSFGGGTLVGSVVGAVVSNVVGYGIGRALGESGHASADDAAGATLIANSIGLGANAVATIVATKSFNEMVLPAITGEPKR